MSSGLGATSPASSISKALPPTPGQQSTTLRTPSSPTRPGPPVTHGNGGHSPTNSISSSISALPPPVVPSRSLPSAPGPVDTETTGMGYQGSTTYTSAPKPAAAATTGVTSGVTTGVTATGANSDNPFDVDLVLPYDISTKGDRLESQKDAAAGYKRLISALESAGLRVASRPGRGAKGSEEVWVFVSAGDALVKELLEAERLVDRAHELPTTQSSSVITDAMRLRLIWEMLTTSPLQHGLGITPGEGQWKRVKSIMALHDEAKDKAWVERWTVGGDWQVGLLRGLNEESSYVMNCDQPPPVLLYFNYLTFYTLSLFPVAVVSFLTWMFTPADSYPWLYAVFLAFYSTIFIATWRIRERRLAVQQGAYGCESVGRLRPEYVKNHNLKSLREAHNTSDLVRDAKVIGSIPIIIGCGMLLGCVLMGIFMLEAFASHVWHGPGQAILPYLPMALFSLIVPQVVALVNGLSAKLVQNEDHPTVNRAAKSLTAKTFAMNGIVAYLGLYLSSYVYLPFGPYIMDHVQTFLSGIGGEKGVVPADPKIQKLAAAAHGGKVVPVSRLHAHRGRMNVGRLKGQVFAYLVTNQVIGTFLEIGLPFILRFINDWRSGKVSVKEAFGQDEKKAEDPEKRFLDKVQAELELPEYNIFTDYAEMVTQFGYVVIWSIVWPLAPVFALVNNYFELRSDALKICRHVRRPLGPRVESIGPWLNTLSIIAWIGAWTSATLIQLFRPRDIETKCSATTAGFLASYEEPPSFKQVWPTIVPVALSALAASHAFILLRWAVNSTAERLLWRGSPEELFIRRREEAGRSGKDLDESLNRLYAAGEKSITRQPGGGFWNGGDEGMREIQTMAKTE